MQKNTDHTATETYSLLREMSQNGEHQGNKTTPSRAVYPGRKENMKLNEEQMEEITRAMETLITVMHDVEDTGKGKRIVQRLDKAIGILYNIISE